MKKVLVLIMLFALVCPAGAGDPQLVYEIATEGICFIGARAAGMGGAQIAAADDGSALWYNPALLWRAARPEFSASLAYQRLSERSIIESSPPVRSAEYQFNNTIFGSLWGVFPVGRGNRAVAMALGINRVNDFNKILRFESAPGWWLEQTDPGFGGGEDDRGGLYAYSAGLGVDISPRASVGLAIDLFDGNNDYAFRFDSLSGGDYYSYRRTIDNDYTGYSGRFGLSYATGDIFQLGVLIRFPTSLTVNQALEEYEELNGDYDRSYAAGRYRFVTPFGFGFGAAYSFRNLLLAADLNYADYTQMEYKSGVDRFQANDDVKKYYRDVVSFAFGAEYSLPDKGLSLRAGVNRQAMPFKYLSNGNEPTAITGGASLLLSRNLKADFGIAFSRWETRDRAYFTDNDRNVPLTAGYRTGRFMFALSCRI